MSVHHTARQCAPAEFDTDGTAPMIAFAHELDAFSRSVVLTSVVETIANVSLVVSSCLDPAPRIPDTVSFNREASTPPPGTSGASL